MSADKKSFTVILDENATIVDYIDENSILGYNKDDVMGRNWFETFIANSDHDKVMKVFKGLFDGEEQEWESYNNDVTTKSGNHIFIDFKNKIFTDKSGNKMIRSVGIEHFLNG